MLSFKHLSIIIAIFTLFASSSVVLAGPKQSENYQLRKESFFSGDDNLQSENYRTNSTIGESVVGRSSGANYLIDQGYRHLGGDELYLYASLTVNTIDLGDVTPVTVKSESTVLNVITNASGGYQATIQENQELQISPTIFIADVLDGTVTAGESEYGVAATGADAALGGNDTRIQTTPLTIATSTAPTTILGTDTTLEFKVAIGAAQDAGTYQHKNRVNVYAAF